MKYSYNLGRLQGSVNTDKVTRWIPGGGKVFQTELTEYERFTSINEEHQHY